MYIGIVQQNPLLVEPYGTDEFSISPRFSPMIFDPHANSVFLREHLCTAVLLLVHLCTAVLIGSIRKPLCSNLFMMGAWRPIYTYVQRECSAEPSIGRILWDWGVFHLSSVQANSFWSPCKSSALTSTPLYSSTPTSTSLYSGINRLYAQNPVFELFMMRAWRPIYTYVQRECSAEPSIGRSCVTETFSISPRFTPMIFYLHTNSVLLRAHLCTGVLLLARLCTAVLIGSMRRICVRNCSW